MSRQSTALNSITQYAMPPEFGGSGERSDQALGSLGIHRKKNIFLSLNHLFISPIIKQHVLSRKSSPLLRTDNEPVFTRPPNTCYKLRPLLFAKRRFTSEQSGIQLNVGITAVYFD